MTYVQVQAACVRLIQKVVLSPDMAKNRWSWRPFGAAMAEDCRLKHQEGIEEKLERIIGLKPDAVHVGVCVKQRTDNGDEATCKTIAEICERLQAAGLTIVEGTH